MVIKQAMISKLQQRYHTLWLVFLSILLIPAYATADITPRTLLNNFLHSAQRASYSASFVFIRPSGMQSADEFVDIRDDGMHRRTLFFQKGDVEMVKSPTTVSYYNQANAERLDYAHDAIYHELSSLFSNLDEVSQYYSIQAVEGAEHVAERETYRISVMAKLPGRYSKIFWIDKQNFIVLRVDVLDEDGQLIERMKCTSLVVKVPELINLLVSKEKKSYRHLKLSALSGHSTVKFDWLPEKYKVVARLGLHDKGSFERRITLSDGFSSFNVIINPHNQQSNKVEANHERDAQQQYVIDVADEQLIVIGDVPFHVVKKTALGVRRIH